MAGSTSPQTGAAETLGIIGLPISVQAMATQHWEVIIVGGGHNGLTCASYLARAGKKVLLLEARERIGGACTLEEPWPGYRFSPCAYLAGLLHPLVLEELNFPAYGYAWSPSPEGMFVPFDDGSSIQLWDDDERCEAEIRRFSPRDVQGWRAMSNLMKRTRDVIRPAGPEDMWLGAPPSRAMIEARLGGDTDAINLLFNWSMLEYVEHFIQDERLQCAYLGQGVIGTNASPHDPGTASIHFHHSSGRLGGRPGMWGFVQGGMGHISFILCDIARASGATVAAGVPVARIMPGVGVELEAGERLHAPLVVSNADPQVTLRLLGQDADATWRTQVEALPMQSPTVKINTALHTLPNFTARPGTWEPHHFGQVNTPLSKHEWQAYHALAKQGHLPPRLWTELYFQTPHDASVAPPGMQTMSIFAQYVPYTFAQGTWDTRRDEVGWLAINSIARYCSNLPEAVVHLEVLGPPDVERKVGLSGGHIFQGECLPPYMWDKRLAYRTPMPGVYLCGACTHPGGSVIAINGRNAAMEILGSTPQFA